MSAAGTAGLWGAIHLPVRSEARAGAMTIDVEALRPAAAEVALVVGLLAEMGEMTASEVAAICG